MFPLRGHVPHVGTKRPRTEEEAAPEENFGLPPSPRKQQKEKFCCPNDVLEFLKLLETFFEKNIEIEKNINNENKRIELLRQALRLISILVPTASMWLRSKGSEGPGKEVYVKDNIEILATAFASDNLVLEAYNFPVSSFSMIGYMLGCFFRTLPKSETLGDNYYFERKRKRESVKLGWPLYQYAKLWIWQLE
jgi:hypothetical protein